MTAVAPLLPAAPALIDAEEGEHPLLRDRPPSFLRTVSGRSVQSTLSRRKLSFADPQLEAAFEQKEEHPSRRHQRAHFLLAAALLAAAYAAAFAGVDDDTDRGARSALLGLATAAAPAAIAALAARLAPATHAHHAPALRALAALLLVRDGPRGASRAWPWSGRLGVARRTRPRRLRPRLARRAIDAPQPRARAGP